MSTAIQTKNSTISANGPCYFIADIAANHDGSLNRAKQLIRLAALSGANAAKFQNFKANTIVSRQGFGELGEKIAHQSSWEKDVFDVYEEAELPWEWTEELISCCDENGIDYFTAPYDLDFVDQYADRFQIIKVGSGDITWAEALEKYAKSKKYVFLATGASTIEDVSRAVNILETGATPLVIMQCNTNYSGSLDNFNHLNLRTLNQYSELFPNAILGLSDHTPGHVAVLGAVSLGARVIEKHFTDDNKRTGPDHYFSLDPDSWKRMVADVRILESALGDGQKKIEENEKDSIVVQRRALRFRRNLQKGTALDREDLIALRPCPKNGVPPYKIDELIGRRLIRDVKFDELVIESLLE